MCPGFVLVGLGGFGGGGGIGGFVAFAEIWGSFVGFGKGWVVLGCLERVLGGLGACGRGFGFFGGVF